MVLFYTNDQTRSIPALGGNIRRTTRSGCDGTRDRLKQGWTCWDMHIDVGWDNEEKTVVRWTFGSTWTLTEFQAAVQESKRLVQSVRHAVDLICDLDGTSHLPDDFLPLFLATLEASSPNRDLIVAVRANRQVEAGIRAFNQVYGPYLHLAVLLAPSVGEARTLIAQRRAGG